MYHQPTNIFEAHIKKYVSNAIGKRYLENTNEILERIAHNISNKKDTEQFLIVLSEMYNAGYQKAMESTSKSLRENGIEIKIVNK